MCYLVAKDRDAHGCFALKTTHGRHLVELKRELNKAVGYKGIQLVTISRPTESDVAEKVQDAFEKYRETQDYKTALLSTAADLDLSKASVTSWCIPDGSDYLRKV